MVTSSGTLVPGGIGVTPGSIATTGPVNIAPSFMTSLGSGGRSAAERARKLKDAGVKGDLGKTEADAARGQAGAEGELQAMERWVRQGTKADDIESLPEIQNGPKNPDFRVKGVLTEVKTRVDPLGESSFIKDKIKEANNQIKKSGLDKDSPMIGVDSKGPQGQVEIQLNGDSAATLSSYKAIEKQVTQSFRPDQSRSLHRVVVHDADGLVGEWVRNPSTGKIDLKAGRGHTP
ncbi:hypothetical protein [Nannocystis pusilla]|uniref:hypothetical protein n=1 Tax=Nannocystis pusilla TaxID=889268 RepID=UPI003DA37063